MGKARKAQQKIPESDSDSSGPPLVESPETSEEEWERTKKEEINREMKRLEAKNKTAKQKKVAAKEEKQIAKIAEQKRLIASKNKEIAEKFAELNKVERLLRPIYGSASSGSDAMQRTVAVPAQPENPRAGYTGSNTKLKPDIQATTHRIVDPMTDEGVWVVVDEGANSCCHGDGWRRNAEDKIYKKGFRFDAVHHKPTQFRGIGNKSTKGLWTVPLGFKLRDSDDLFQGSCQSHELADSDFPLLLSQSVQAHMYFIKDMSAGTIMLGDTGEFLEVVRQKNTGLFMIRIDHLDVNTYIEETSETQDHEEKAKKLILPWQVLEELEKQFLIENAAAIAEIDARRGPAPEINTAEWTFAGCDSDDPTPTACMHTQQPLTPAEIQKLARSDITMVTCGALTFEDSPYSACPTRKAFQRYINHTPGDNQTQYSLNHVPTQKCFKEEFGRHFPFLTQGRQTILINCNHLRDPHSQRKLTHHIGLHPATLLQTAKHEELELLLQDLKTVRADPKRKWLIIFVCRKGTHRSVAVSELVELLFDKYIYDDVDAIENYLKNDPHCAGVMLKSI